MASLQPPRCGTETRPSLVSGCSRAAESRHPSAIQRPRGLADGRQWLLPEHRTRKLPSVSWRGPRVIERRGNIARRAGLRPARHVRNPSVPRTLGNPTTPRREASVPRSPLTSHRSPRISSLTRCSRMHGNIALWLQPGPCYSPTDVMPENSGPASPIAIPVSIPIHDTFYQ